MSVLLLFALTQFHQALVVYAAPRYDGLVLESGGMRGVSFVGAIQAFSARGLYNDGSYGFENVIGTSVGCIFGLAVALDIPPDSLERLVLDTDFQTLFDSNIKRLLDYPVKGSGRFSNIIYAYRWIVYFYNQLQTWLDNTPRFGLSDDSRLHAWISERLIPLSKYADRISTSSTLTDLTDITDHSLTCFATRLYRVGIVRMSAKTTPNLTLREVVHASATLPIILQPRFDADGFPLLDGGLLMNFPIYELDGKFGTANVLGLSLNPAIYNTKDVTPGTCEFGVPRASFISNAIVTMSNLFRAKRHVSLDGKKIKSAAVIHSSVDFIKHITNIIIHDREWLRYSSDPMNCDRVIYLNSSLNVLDLDATKEKIKIAISVAYENALNFIDNIDALTCNCLTYIHRQCET